MINYINHFLLYFIIKFGKALNYSASLGPGAIVRCHTRMLTQKGYDNHHLS